uniref:Uncharacterized protein n=1 Tax=Avena sativa TaxID=4498 RepID=A0ACD5VAW3_AVESA
MFLGCRHGLMLILHMSQLQLLVWDPVTDDQHRLDIPPGFSTNFPASGAVLGDAGDDHNFQVVFLGNSDIQHTQLVASLYSSKTGVWGNLATASALPGNFSTWVYPRMLAVMVGGSLYWSAGKFLAIIEFDLNRQSLALIPMPGEEALTAGMDNAIIWITSTESGGLGLFFLLKFSARLWKARTNFDGAISWVLERTIALDKLLSINSEEEAKSRPSIVGFAKDNTVVLLHTSTGIFMVHLESLKFKELFKPSGWHAYYLFEGVYTAGITKLLPPSQNRCLKFIKNWMNLHTI